MAASRRLCSFSWRTWVVVLPPRRLRQRRRRPRTPSELPFELTAAALPERWCRPALERDSAGEGFAARVRNGSGAATIRVACTRPEWLSRYKQGCMQGARKMHTQWRVHAWLSRCKAATIRVACKASGDAASGDACHRVMTRCEGRRAVMRAIQSNSDVRASSLWGSGLWV